MNLDAVMSHKPAPIEHTYTQTDTILYALGLSLGLNPVETEQLHYVYENELRTLPSICNVLAHPGFWLQQSTLGIDWVSALHGEQRFVIHKPLASQGSVHGVTRVLGVDDKGRDRGALLFYEKVVTDRATAARLCTVQTTGFLRGDGGCGSGGALLPPLEPVPMQGPDAVLDWPTTAQAALIYRLCGDRNPLHADPAVAARAGFQRPILQGLCTMGMACFCLIDMYCKGHPELLGSMAVRFGGVVYPGETLRIESWRRGRTIQFRARVLERPGTVLDRGLVELNA